MQIRLSKVIRELGVGRSTVVEFLQKKGYSIESDLNTKITDEQYAVLLKEFSKDKKQKEESDKFSQERQNNKERIRGAVLSNEPNKKKEELIEVTVPETERPHIKEVGKIDLEALNKRAASNPAPEVKETTVKVEKKQPEQKANPEPKKEEPSLTAPQEKPQVKVEEKVEKTQPASVQPKAVAKPKTTENKPVEKKKAEQKPTDNKPVEKKVVSEEKKPQPKQVEEKPVEEITPLTKEEEEVFSYGTTEVRPQPKVTGFINLDELNQSTRPPKKSKEVE